MGEGLLQPPCKWYTNVKHAIQSLGQEERLSVNEGKALMLLVTQGDPNIQAIWDVYSVLKDSDDLLESFKVLLQVREQP